VQRHLHVINARLHRAVDPTTPLLVRLDSVLVGTGICCPDTMIAFLLFDV